MYISKLSLINYRNFANAKLLFNKGINTIIGENGSGKTNLFRAIRLLLDDNMVRSAYKLEEHDFHRGLKQWQGHWIIISLEFEEISSDEAIQALFLHGTGNNVAGEVIAKATYNLIFRPKKEIRLQLFNVEEGDRNALNAVLKKITLGDYEAVFTGKSEADFNNSEFYKKIVGDFDSVKFPDPKIEFPEIGAKIPAVLSLNKEISFTFIQALRDVVSEFHNNRTNPLLTLLKLKSGEINTDVFESIIETAKNLNNEIEKLQDVQDVRRHITETIKEAAGETYSPSSLSIKSDLPVEADKLFQSLKLFVGESEESYEGAIHELSLGGANLIYLTLKLLAFKYQKTTQAIANFLLIEEPEAHIHTHIQKTLFDRLNFSDTQIIYSTHSTNISEVSNVRNMNVIGRNKWQCEAYQPTTGLDELTIGSIQRYLDAVRCNLLFAKSVVLVEGDAEEILIPILIKKVFGISLDELGISLVNIRSTGFKNVAVLFHDTRIRKRCSIVTDLDTSIFKNAPPLPADASDNERKFRAKCQGSEDAGINRRDELNAFAGQNPWVKVFFASNTFEVDFVAAGNADKVVGILNEVYRDSSCIEKSKAELESSEVAQYGKRVLTMANQEGKGWFAVLLGSQIDENVAIPDYIVDAILFAHAEMSTRMWFNILNYRLDCINKHGVDQSEVIDRFRVQLNRFKCGEVDLPAIRDEMSSQFPQDQINKILSRL